jgi:hypothetical protein
MNAAVGDLHPIEPLAEQGRPSTVASEVTRRDNDELGRRIVGQPESLAELEELALDSAFSAQNVEKTYALVSLLDAAGRRPAFIERLIERCADPGEPCGDDALELVRASIAVNGTARVTPEDCAVGAAAIGSLLEGGDERAVSAAFAVTRGLFVCEQPAMRRLALLGLDVATEPDKTLPDPAYSSYGSWLADCMPTTTSEGAVRLGSECKALPRYAGTWLGAHCGPDAIERARAIEATRPREPYDPREDQVLDGALRVLGACDEAAFEAAIAHLPETVSTPANVRSKENMRIALSGPPHRSN